MRASVLLIRLLVVLIPKYLSFFRYGKGFFDLAFVK